MKPGSRSPLRTRDFAELVHVMTRLKPSVMASVMDSQYRPKIATPLEKAIEPPVRLSAAQLLFPSGPLLFP